jgi:hypothetical protein
MADSRRSWRYRAAEGAALLLAALAPPVRGETVYDQTDHCTNQGSAVAVTSETVAGIPFYNSFVADDFFVPAGASWSIDAVSPFGIYFSSGTPSAATSFNVFFLFGPAGTPLQDAACAYYGQEYATTNVSLLETFFDVVLDAPCVLPGGTHGAVYWVSVQANMAQDTDWGWQERFAQTGSPAHVAYPNGAGGDACTTWSLKTDCVGAFTAPHPDQCFRLAGSAPIIFSSGFDS